MGLNEFYTNLACLVFTTVLQMLFVFFFCFSFFFFVVPCALHLIKEHWYIYIYIYIYIYKLFCILNPRSRSQWPRGLGVGSRPHACWDWEFESHQGHECLSVVIVMCWFKVEDSATSDHSFRGVILTVVRRCAWSRNVVNEEVLPNWGLLRHIKYPRKNKINLRYIQDPILPSDRQKCSFAGRKISVNFI